MPTQTVNSQRPLDRTDHVWLRRRGGYKCVLCGGITSRPPQYPTPKDWVPTRYEPLDDEERLLVPASDGAGFKRPRPS